MLMCRYNLYFGVLGASERKRLSFCFVYCPYHEPTALLQCVCVVDVCVVPGNVGREKCTGYIVGEFVSGECHLEDRTGDEGARKVCIA